MTQQTPTDDSRYPDKETKDIVEQLEKEGVKPLTDPSSKSDEDDEEGEPEGGKGKEPDKKPDEPEKKPDDPDKPDTTEKKPDQQRQDRRQVLIPIARVKQNEKKMRDEFTTQISDLTNQVKTLQDQVAKGTPGAEAALDDKVAKLKERAAAISTKHGADPDFIQDILATFQELAQAGVKAPPELAKAVETIEAIKAETDAQAEVDATLTKYDDEFATQISGNKDLVDQIRASGLTIEQFKERMQELVLGEDGEKYAKLSLSEVYALKRDDLLPKKAKSAEAPHGRTTTGASDSGGETKLVSAEEIKDMTEEEFQKYSDNLGKQSRSRLTRNGRPV